MAAETTFTLNFKTIAELTGLDRLMNGVQNGVKKIEVVNGELRKIAASANTLLAGAGSFLALNKLQQYAEKSVQVMEGQAAFAVQVMRSKDGSEELFNTLSKLNIELARTTGTSESASRAIEQQLLLYGATAENIEPLTRGIIDFAAARGKDAQSVADFISRALSGEDLQLARLGIRIDKTKSYAQQVQSLLEQFGKVQGIAQIIDEADGGLSEYRLAWEKLTISIGNFINLIRIPFLVGLTGGLESVKGKLDAVNDSTGNLAKTIIVTAGMTGRWVGENMNLIGSIVGVGGGLLLLRTSLGLIGPQATTVIAALFAVNAAYTALTNTVMGAPVTMTDAYAVALQNTVTVFEAMRGIISGSVKFFVAEVLHIVSEARIKILELAKGTAQILSTLSGGMIKIDTFGWDVQIQRLKMDSKALSKEAGAAWSQVVTDGLKGMTDAQANMEKKIEEVRNRGLKGDAAKAEFEKLADEQLKYLERLLARMRGQAGTGVLGGADGADNSGAKTAATEALTAAKYRLAAAEQEYKTALETTKLLEESGQITRDQANARNLQATRDYIAELERARAAIPALVAQMEAVGNTKGAQEAKLQYQELTTKILEAQRVLADSSVFGQMRAQIRQLAAEWANVGKQVGGFLTQQFQNFAQTAGQMISNLIFRTGNWKQSIVQLAQSFVTSLATMLIQWILARTVMALLNKAFGKADAQATNAQATQAAAAWAPAATSASIASYGAAAGTGVAAYLAALGIGTAAAIGASSVGGFKQGGFTGHGPETGVAGPVHFEEVVFPAPRVRELGRDWLVNLAVGSLPQPSGYQRGGIGGSAPGSGGGGGFGAALPAVNVAFFDDRQALEQWLRSQQGTTIIYDAVTRRRIDLGI